MFAHTNQFCLFTLTFTPVPPPKKKGKYGEQNQCKLCEAGYYQDGKGELQCSKCPINTYSNEEGKSSAADCTKCPEKTTTGSNTGQVAESACICEEGYYQDDAVEGVQACVACEKIKTNCVGIGLTKDTLPAAPGYFRESNDTIDFFSCDTPDDCPGGVVQDQCSEGHTGVLCACCKQNHVRKEGVCTLCPADIVPDGTNALATMGTVPPFLLFCCLVCYFGKKEKKEEDEDENDESENDEKSKTNTNLRSTTNPTKVAPQVPLRAVPKRPITGATGATGATPQVTSQAVPASTASTLPVSPLVAAPSSTATALHNTRVHGAMSIQVWWLRHRMNVVKEDTLAAIEGETKEQTQTRQKSAHAQQRKDHLNAMRLETALALHRGKEATAHVREDMFNAVEEVAQGEAEGAAEGEVATATGDTTGGEIEADTGDVQALHHFLPPMKMTSLSSSLGHKIRILIGYLQITSSLVTSFDVPWPPITLNLFQSLTFINFNFMDFFAPLDPCALYTPFLKQAAFHMAILPLCLCFIVPAALLAMCCCNKAKAVMEKAGHVTVTFIFLLYPGIVTRVFTTLKCKQVGDHQYLVADYCVMCNVGEHAQYVDSVFVALTTACFTICLQTYENINIFQPLTFLQVPSGNAVLCCVLRHWYSSGLRFFVVQEPTHIATGRHQR